MTAAAPSLSTAFITDAIADFKGRLDTLMEESLSKYRDLTVAGLEDEYTDGYGMITTLAGGCPPTGQGCYHPHLLHIPSDIPTDTFKKGVWIIHSCFFKRVQYTSVERHGGYGGTSNELQERDFSGSAIDNYGNLYYYSNHNMYGWDFFSSWKSQAEKKDNYVLPLSNSLIDLVKAIPENLGHEGPGYHNAHAYPLRSHFLPDHVMPLVKRIAELMHKSRQSVLKLQRDLAAATSARKSVAPSAAPLNPYGELLQKFSVCPTTPDLTTLQKELVAERERAESLQRQLIAEKFAAQTLKEKTTLLEAELSIKPTALQAQIAALQKELTAAQTFKEKTAATIADLTTRYETTVTSNRIQIDGLRAQIDSLKLTHTSPSAEKRALQAQIASLQKALTAEKEKSASLQKSLTAEKEKSAALNCAQKAEKDIRENHATAAAIKKSATHSSRRQATVAADDTITHVMLPILSVTEIT
jgi:hypothetical protein